jgi:hypothetical protein
VCVRVQVIFPLLKELLVPRPTARAEAAALEETRQRASALASKIFLQCAAPPLSIESLVCGLPGCGSWRTYAGWEV